MADAGFPQPSSSYRELIKIIQGYGRVVSDASLSDKRDGAGAVQDAGNDVESHIAAMAGTDGCRLDGRKWDCREVESVRSGAQALT